MEYFTQHAQYLRRADSERRNLKYWLDYFGEIEVRNIRPHVQRKFVKFLASKNFAKSTIEGIFKTGISAINFSWSEEMLLNKPPFIDLSKELKKHNIVKNERWRAIEINEMVGMFEHSTSDRLTRYLMLLIAGTSRSSAGIEVTDKNIDLQSATIDLLQDGEEQTNKYRATVKLPSFIKAIYCTGNICSQTPKTPNINNLRNRQWIPTRKAAGLSHQIVPYSVRHGMAKWLRTCGVAPWDLSAQMGHKRKGSETTEIYASFDPSYLSEALEAIEAYFAIIYSQCTELQTFMQGRDYNHRCDLVAKYSSKANL